MIARGEYFQGDVEDETWRIEAEFELKVMSTPSNFYGVDITRYPGTEDERSFTLTTGTGNLPECWPTCRHFIEGMVGCKIKRRGPTGKQVDVEI